jgi:hypothetical protein
LNIRQSQQEISEKNPSTTAAKALQELQVSSKYGCLLNAP